MRFVFPKTIFTLSQTAPCLPLLGLPLPGVGVPAVGGCGLVIGAGFTVLELKLFNGFMRATKFEFAGLLKFVARIGVLAGELGL